MKVKFLYITKLRMKAFILNPKFPISSSLNILLFIAIVIIFHFCFLHIHLYTYVETLC